MCKVLVFGLPLTILILLIYFSLCFANLVMWSCFRQFTSKISSNMTKYQTTAELALVGDSITAWFQTDGRVYYEAHFQHLKPVNFGVPGDTTDQTIRRLNGGMLGHLQSSKVTTVLIGTNDLGWGHSPEEISSQIGKIIEILQRELVGTYILLLGILPRGAGLDLPRKVNVLIEKYDNGKDVKFLDMSQHFSNEGKVVPKLYRADQLHLSPEGYRVFAETIHPIISEILNDKSIHE